MWNLYNLYNMEAIKFCCTYIYLFKNSTLRNSTGFTMFNYQNKICNNGKINFKGVFIDEKTDERTFAEMFI